MCLQLRLHVVTAHRVRPRCPRHPLCPSRIPGRRRRRRWTGAGGRRRPIGSTFNGLNNDSDLQVAFKRSRGISVVTKESVQYWGETNQDTRIVFATSRQSVPHLPLPSIRAPMTMTDGGYVALRWPLLLLPLSATTDDNAPKKMRVSSRCTLLHS